MFRLHSQRVHAYVRLTYIQSRLLACLFAFLVVLSACTASPPQNSKTNTPHIATSTTPAAATYAFPAVDANYVYDQLYYMSTNFQQRESGFDLSTEHNGHKAFAQYWAQAMQQNLQGFAPQVTYDYFQSGWISRPGDSSGYNVEVTIPGAVHPEQVVVVGTHYDGMHVSQGSAFDDTSGSAILLGQAKALADYWRAHQLYPDRTLRFVIFDAEEEGLLGSYDYVNSTVNGDTANIVAMINEEQSGFSYPVRFLGKASNPVIPLHIWNVNGSQTYFADLMRSALPTVASEMRTMGYTSALYHDSQGKDVRLPIFTNDQIAQMLVTGESLGGSDDAAFDQANVSALTFIAGDDGLFNAQTGSFEGGIVPANQQYPYDTHDDTIQLMNGYANGETSKSQALALSLDFQTMLAAWMLDQPAMVGQIAADQLAAGPLAAISSVGILQAGVPLKLNALASFDPRSPQSTLKAHWDFGDGVQVDGLTVQHVYANAGTYPLTLTVQDANGSRQVSKKLVVTTNALKYTNILLLTHRDDPALAAGDHAPTSGFVFPQITQDGDGLTSSDHFPGHNW